MDDHPHQHQSMATAAAASMSSSKSKKLQGGGERSGRGSGGGNSPPAMRKGPWTEEEDAQLVWFVRLFGERRWDFLAKVSGLRRTGKSCRLRWVNYLHPGLRRGRITAEEERLILQLHAQWGSRWSRIARSLPGRTDNEIKNFWRTRARKQKAAAQQQHDGRSSKTASASAFSGSSSTSSVTATTSSRSGSPSPSSGGCGTATSSSAVTVTESALRQSSGSGDNDDDEDAELDEASTTTAASQHQHHQQQQQQQECYASDHFFWNDIAAAEAASYMFIDGWAGAGPGHPAAAAAGAELPSSPAWEYYSDYSLWRIDDDEYYKKLLDSS